jgi:hypothetical protein
MEFVLYLDLTIPTIPMPIPAPRYKKAAIAAGGIYCSRNFEKGEPAAYKVAANTAQSTDILQLTFIETSPIY